jgi:hypothetical protein
MVGCWQGKLANQYCISLSIAAQEAQGGSNADSSANSASCVAPRKQRIEQFHWSPGSTPFAFLRVCVFHHSCR